MRNNKQTVPTTKNTSTTPDETIRYMELSDEDAIRVVGGHFGVSDNIQLPAKNEKNKPLLWFQNKPKWCLPGESKREGCWCLPGEKGKKTGCLLGETRVLDPGGNI